MRQESATSFTYLVRDHARLVFYAVTLFAAGLQLDASIVLTQRADIIGSDGSLLRPEKGNGRTKGQFTRAMSRYIRPPAARISSRPATRRSDNSFA